jgi:hypothetical protein
MATSKNGSAPREKMALSAYPITFRMGEKLGDLPFRLLSKQSGKR